jgi:hypothetical protein
VGKSPAPFPGAWEEFCTTFKALTAMNFNARAMGGQWGGRSPDAIFREKQAAGWRPVTIDPIELDSAFMDRHLRKVDRAALRIGSERYHHPALNGLPNGSPVEIALPWRRGATPLFRPPGGEWAYVEIDHPFHATWKEGAVEAGRRQRVYRKAVAARAKAADAFDPMAASLDMAANYTPPQPIGRADRLDAGGELRALAHGRASGPAPAQEEITAEERNRRRREAVTARLLRSQANVA